MSGKSQNLFCLVLSPLTEMKILSVVVITSKSPKLQKLIFSRSVLFHLKTRVVSNIL